jgi:hypothetical protein
MNYCQHECNDMRKSLNIYIYTYIYRYIYNNFNASRLNTVSYYTLTANTETRDQAKHTHTHTNIRGGHCTFSTCSGQSLRANITSNLVIACGGHSLITLEQPLTIYKFTALQRRKAQFFCIIKFIF